jgi:kumamolisin
MYERKVPLFGSDRRALPGAHDIGDVDRTKMISVSVYLRPNPAATPLPSLEEQALVPPAQRRMPSAAEVEAARGARPDDIAAVEMFANRAGLNVVESSAAKRSVRLGGTIDALCKAFATDVRRYAHVTGDYRGRVGPVNIPLELRGIVRGVFGFDNRRVGRSYRQRYSTRSAFARLGGVQGHLPTQLAALYSFPPTLDGSGQSVAILAFNGAIADTGISAKGGYREAGLRRYFTQHTGTRMPTITDVVVHGPGNQPGDEFDPMDSTGEILLDIETVGAVAPGAALTIYFTEFTEQGWVDALHAIVHDPVNNPSIISISYGNAETTSNAIDPDTRGSLWTNAAIDQANMAFEDAAHKNITICCASGDDGSADQVQDQLAHVDFPASSPFVVACGGTRLQMSAGRLTSESVWNNGPGSAGGGGISDLFAVPSWQQSAGVPASANPGHRIGRGVPDVAADADPATGVLVSDVDGNVDSTRPTGGTSAAAPLWSGLVARLNQGLGAHLGFLTPRLYSLAGTAAFRDVKTGDNGVYRAASGWDPCTGLGTPDGSALLQALAGGGIIHVAQTMGSGERLSALDERMTHLEAEVEALRALFGKGISGV